MSVSEYYGGQGKKVMSKMKKSYGESKGERVFYATANKKGKGKSKGPSFGFAK